MGPPKPVHECCGLGRVGSADTHKMLATMPKPCVKGVQKPACAGSSLGRGAMGPLGPVPGRRGLRQQARHPPEDGPFRSPHVRIKGWTLHTRCAEQQVECGLPCSPHTHSDGEGPLCSPHVCFTSWALQSRFSNQAGHCNAWKGCNPFCCQLCCQSAF